MVFIATLTAARLAQPVSELHDYREHRSVFRIDYEFEVREVLKGDPAGVTLFSQHPYHDPKKRPWTFAADHHFSPGENIVVLADGAGETQLSTCSRSKSLDWGDRKAMFEQIDSLRASASKR